MANVGDTVVFTFTVSHDIVLGDRSPITNVTVTDDRAGSATYVNGDDTHTSIQASASGDGSPVSNVAVTDDFAGVASYVRGDDGDGLLKVGEAWVYTASYTIQATDPNPLVNEGLVTGEDRDGDPISDTVTHSTTTHFIFLPIVLKNY
jgi:hypothetical protein